MLFRDELVTQLMVADELVRERVNRLQAYRVSGERRGRVCMNVLRQGKELDGQVFSRPEQYGSPNAIAGGVVNVLSAPADHINLARSFVIIAARAHGDVVAKRHINHGVEQRANVATVDGFEPCLPSHLKP
jgi:hypothetical protein